MHKTQPDRSEGRLEHTAPRSYRFKAHNRIPGPLLICAVALGTLLMSSAFAQVLEGTILLPDSLGPLTGKTHVVFDENPDHPRMFIGSEDGDVLVLDAITCQRIARIPTGPVASICYSPKHNRLYTATVEGYTVVVADCSSYQVAKELQFSEYVNGLFYNPVVDRVYCGTDRMKVIDCAADSVWGTLGINAVSACFAFDSARNELFIGAADTFRILDCSRDSVVASIPELRASQAVCYQPSAGKVYVAAGESLFALRVDNDSIVYRRHYDTLNPLLVSDPVHNRVYYTYLERIVALDCAYDSVIWTQYPWTRTIAMAADSEQDKLYVLLVGLHRGYPSVLDGTTGSELLYYPQSKDSALYFCSAAKRWYLIWNSGEVTASDSRSDTITGVAPLVAHISDVCMDSVDNKLYFSAGKSGIGVVDCSSNRVTSYVRPCYVPCGYGGILPQCMAIDSRDRKLYYGGDSGIYVIDCTIDSVVKKIPTQGWVQTLDWYPAMNKLYAVERPWDGGGLAAVIDCTRDTVLKYLPLNDSAVWEGHVALLAPEFDQLWLFSCGQWYSVVDCRTDSIVEDTTAGRMTGYEYTGYCPADRKIFGIHYRGLGVLDIDSRLPADSIIFFSNGATTNGLFVSTEAHKLYWNVLPSVFPFVDSLAVVDTRTDSITRAFLVPFEVMRMCGGRTGNYIYLAGLDWNTPDGHLAVIDTRTDSIVSSVRTPVSTCFLTRNSRTNRLYAVGWAGDSVIQVVYDSVVFAGLQARPGDVTPAKCLQTLLNRSTPLRVQEDVGLYDASGRRAVILRSGPNDISHLAPGVYFVRRPRTDDGRPDAVQKIVVAR